MFLKWFSRIFHQKVFNKKNSSNGKKRFGQILSNDFHAFSKADIKQFWWFNVTKKMERWENWVQPTRKGKCAVVPLSSSFSCFINKITSVQNKFPRWTSKCINFFLPQIIVFHFPKFVICWLHIGERKPFVSKQLFWWRSKNHNKTPPNSEKKMIWLNAKSSRQTKVVWF